MIRRANQYLNKRPLLAIILGFLLLAAVAVVIVPADPAGLGKPITRSAT